MCLCAVGFLLCLDKADYPDAAVLVGQEDLSFQYEVRDARYYKTARMRELDEVWGLVPLAPSRLSGPRACSTLATSHPSSSTWKVRWARVANGLCVHSHMSRRWHRPAAGGQGDGEGGGRLLDLRGGTPRSRTQIMDCSPMLLQLGAAFAELDVLLSLADAASDLKYVRPEFVEDNVVFIKVSRPIAPLGASVDNPTVRRTVGIHSRKLRSQRSLRTTPRCGTAAYVLACALSRVVNARSCPQGQALAVWALCRAPISAASRCT